MFLVLPPVSLLLPGLAGVVLLPRRAGRLLCGLALAGLLVFALPVTGSVLTLALEQDTPAPPETPAAIIILGGDTNRIGRAPAAVEIGPMTLERLRAGAAVQRATLLPVLVSGGVVGPDQPPVAALMAHSLEADFAVPVRWQEDASLDTWENARDSAAILHTAGIRSVFLVTHAWHMRRALIAFRRFGIAAQPAPVAFRYRAYDLGAFIPRVTAWAESYYAVHEWVGCAWYALRARL